MVSLEEIETVWSGGEEDQEREVRKKVQIDDKSGERKESGTRKGNKLKF